MKFSSLSYPITYYVKSHFYRSSPILRLYIIRHMQHKELPLATHLVGNDNPLLLKKLRYPRHAYCFILGINARENNREQ